MGVERQSTSLRVDKSLWLTVRAYCLKNRLKVHDFIEDLIKERLKGQKFEFKF